MTTFDQHTQQVYTQTDVAGNMTSGDTISSGNIAKRKGIAQGSHNHATVNDHTTVHIYQSNQTLSDKAIPQNKLPKIVEQAPLPVVRHEVV